MSWIGITHTGYAANGSKDIFSRVRFSKEPGATGFFRLITDRRIVVFRAGHLRWNRDEAEAVLVGGPVARQRLHDWAVEGKLAVELDGYSVPLAVSDYETMRRFEGRSRSRIRQEPVGPREML